MPFWKVQFDTVRIWTQVESDQGERRHTPKSTINHHADSMEINLNLLPALSHVGVVECHGSFRALQAPICQFRPMYFNCFPTYLFLFLSIHTPKAFLSIVAGAGWRSCGGFAKTEISRAAQTTWHHSCQQLHKFTRFLHCKKFIITTPSWTTELWSFFGSVRNSSVQICFCETVKPHHAKIKNFVETGRTEEINLFWNAHTHAHAKHTAHTHTHTHTQNSCMSFARNQAHTFPFQNHLLGVFWRWGVHLDQFFSRNWDEMYAVRETLTPTTACSLPKGNRINKKNDSSLFIAWRGFFA